MMLLPMMLLSTFVVVTDVVTKYGVTNDVLITELLPMVLPQP
jgi:hypothetical protein